MGYIFKASGDITQHRDTYGRKGPDKFIVGAIYPFKVP